MKTLLGRVCNGRLKVDEPVSLPEGTVLELTVADSGDDYTEEERAALHDELERSWKDVEAGRTIDAAEVLSKLRKQK